jgi:hypothetical protein
MAFNVFVLTGQLTPHPPRHHLAFGVILLHRLLLM